MPVHNATKQLISDSCITHVKKTEIKPTLQHFGETEV